MLEEFCLLFCFCSYRFCYCFSTFNRKSNNCQEGIINTNMTLFIFQILYSQCVSFCSEKKNNTLLAVCALPCSLSTFPILFSALEGSPLWIILRLHPCPQVSVGFRKGSRRLKERRRRKSGYFLLLAFPTKHLHWAECVLPLKAADEFI